MKQGVHIVILLVMAITAAASDCRAQYPTGRVMQLNSSNGLSNDYVKSIAQDSLGSIWIATEGGLNRFDGHTFQVYTTDNSGLTSNELNSVYYDHPIKTVWISTQRDGLCFYDYELDSIYPYTVMDGLVTNDIPHISKAHDGGIWVTHYHFGAQHWSRYENESKTRFTYNNVSDKDTGEPLPHPSWVTVDDMEGHLYMGHVNDGMSIIDMSTNSCRTFRHDPDDPNSLPGDEVFTICIDNNGIVWIGTDGGVASYNPSNETFSRIVHRPNDPNSLIPGIIMDIKQMKNGDIWFASSQGGVSILSLKTHAFVKPEEFKFQNLVSSDIPNGINGSNFRTILQDSYGNIWLGSYRNGIDFISSAPRLFSRVEYHDHYSSNFRHKAAWSLAIDNQGRLWIGGENEIACRQHDGKIKTIPLYNAEMHPHTLVRSLYFDSDGHLWIGTDESGAMVYNPTDGRFTPLRGIPRDIRAIYEDPEGRIYIGTIDGLFSATKRFKTAYEPVISSQLEDRSIQEIYRDKSGRLWIGTFGKGLSIFDRNDSLIAQLRIEEGFPSNAVNSMMTDSKDRVWVATRKGAAVFENPDSIRSFRIINPCAENSSLQVRSIEEDADGHIWLSTDKNLVKLDDSLQPVTTYDYYGDLHLNSFLDHSSVTDTNGMMYFGSLNGLFEFDPRRLSNPRQQPPPVITHFYVLESHDSVIDGKQEYRIDNGKVELPYDKNNISISVSTPDYSFNGEVEYSYYMEGIDNVWHTVGNDQCVVFRNLRPGKYVFRVRSRMFGNEWSEETASMQIAIAPPLWLTWWAKVLYGLSAIALIALIARNYKRRLKLKQTLEIERQNSQNRQLLNEERLRFYTNITHELRTPLTLILGPLEDLLSDKDLSSRHTAKIQLIHDSSTRLLNLINGILEFRKTETQNRKLSVEKANLSNLVREIGFRYKELNRNPNVRYAIDIDSDDTEIYFDPDMVTIILDNLLSNANKYTSEGCITLGMRTVEENGVKYTDLTVSDTGHGISHEALTHIFERYYQAKSPYQASGSGIGLALVKSLAELHHATLSVSSEVDKGTSFTLRLLTDNTYPDALHGRRSEMKKNTVETDAPKTVEAEPDDKPILLVVEDDADIRQYVANSLSDEFTVLTAGDGNEGLKLTLEKIPDIVVSDIMMPIMDGISLCRAIREEISTSHVPIVLLTARDSINDKEEGYKAGADSYLTKPFSAKLLRSRLHNLLDKRRRLADAMMSNSPRYDTEHTESTEPPVSINPLDTKFIDKITGIIEANLELEKMDIAFIAGEMAMSHSTLYRKVKAVTGMSVNEFIRKVKLRKAASMLLSGSHTVSEISYMTGFSSVAYFRQCFKAEFGSAPSEYSKNNPSADKQQ